MKEKIWKLLELLNEYEIEKEKSEWVNVDAYVEFKWEWVWEWYLNKWLTRFDETDHWEWDNLYWDTAVAYLISKSFWFIKWLVENDKIDRHKFYDKNILKWFMTLTSEEKADSIIMNLSISDTPIEDLISYLK